MEAGEPVVREGEKADRVFFLVSGRCNVLKCCVGAKDKVRLINHSGPY
eukprot:SAG11_NODE_1537_length_4724_cov_4.318270_9_plen_48_part_00